MADELGRRLREHALLEGDFSCSARAAARRTTSTSTASRRCRSCSALGERLAAAVREHEPEAERLAAPALGAVALAASPRSPRAPVRDRARRGQGVRDGEPARRPPSPVSSSVSLEDVVTSGGALVEAVTAAAKPGSSSGRRSASSTAERGRTRSRGSASASGPLPCRRPRRGRHVRRKSAWLSHWNVEAVRSCC